jgi:methionine-rich copper-binding protein CopC
MKKNVAASLAALLLLLAANSGLASAHANWLHGNIKNSQVFRLGHTPKVIKGYFAEQLTPGKSWMAIFEGVADHGLVTEKDHSVVNYKNPKEMVLNLKHTKLTRDKYYVMWYTQSATDGHYAAGIIYFRVK